MLMLAIQDDIVTILSMNVENFSDQPSPELIDRLAHCIKDELFPVLTPEELDQRDKFTTDRVNWLKQLFGINSTGDSAVPSAMFEQLKKQHIDAIVDVLPHLYEATGEKRQFPASTQQRISHYLGGESNLQIALHYTLSAAAVERERKSVLLTINGTKSSPKTEATREEINRARFKAIISILGDASVSRTVEYPRREPTSLPHQINARPPEKLPIYSAADLLDDLAERFVQSGLLDKNQTHLLRKHFLDTKSELTRDEKSAISQSIRALRSVLATKKKSKPEYKNNAKIYESVTLFENLIGPGPMVPASYAEHVSGMLLQVQGNDEDAIKLSLAADRMRLDRALSWLLYIGQAPPKPEIRKT